MEAAIVRTSKYQGRFQGRIGMVCEYAVYAENGVTHLYHDDNKGGDQAPDYSGSEDGAYAFAGVKPFVHGAF